MVLRKQTVPRANRNRLLRSQNHQERAPPPGHQIPIPTDNRPVIVTFGDSLTQGVAGKNYSAYLQDLLDQQGYHYRVDNQGVSGDTTTDGLARIDNVIAAHPTLVILEFGGNDGLRGVPVESSKANLDEMIARLKAAKLPVVLAGISACRLTMDLSMSSHLQQCFQS